MSMGWVRDVSLHGVPFNKGLGELGETTYTMRQLPSRRRPSFNIHETTGSPRQCNRPLKRSILRVGTARHLHHTKNTCLQGFFFFFFFFKSETRMTASVLKQDPNTGHENNIAQRQKQISGLSPHLIIIIF